MLLSTNQFIHEYEHRFVIMADAWDHLEIE